MFVKIQITLFVFLFFFINNFLLAQTPVEDLKLKNFFPKSLFKTPKAEIIKAKFSVIDAHSHGYNQTPEQIAERVRLMDKWGVGKTILLTYFTGALWDSVYNLYSKYPDHFELWCGFDYTDYDDPRLKLLLDKCAELNLPINIHIADPIWMYEKIDSTNDGLMNAVLYRMDTRKKKVLPHNEQIVHLENVKKNIRILLLLPAI